MDGDQSQAFADPSVAEESDSSDVLPELPWLNPFDEIPDRFGDYEVDRLIARGTHGTVFKATDVHGLRVAVKWLRTRQSDSELGALVQLSKTVNGLPPILGSGTKDDRTYFVMPYYERRSLRFRLRRLPFPQPLSETVRIAGAITDVLGELHRHGYTHADFKPDNVLIESLPASSNQSQHSLLRDDERLVLTDFGTIRSADGAAQFGEGTLGYAAPELLTTIVDHDPRVDIYAASATLVECITGVTPRQVRGPSESAFDESVMRSTGPLEQVLRKGLRFDSQFRHEAISTWFDAILATAQAVEPLTTDSQPRQDISVDPVARVSHRLGDTSRPADGTKRARLHSKDDQVRPVGKSAAMAVALIAFAFGVYSVVVQSRSAPSLTSQTAAISNDVAPDTDPASPATTSQPADDSEDVSSELIPPAPALADLSPDPRWGTPRRHLTAVYAGGDQAAQPNRARYHNIEATSRPVISGDERWILARREDGWTVVDRSTGNFRFADVGSDSQPTWHPAEPATILHLDVGALALLATPLDGKTTVAADLSDRIAAELPGASYLVAPGHGEPSADGSRFAWAVSDDAGRIIGFVSYDLSVDTVLGVKVELPDGDVGRFDSIAMSKSGNNVVVAFEQAYVIYDSDFTNERRIEQRPFSYELALSGEAQDIVVVANFETGTFGAGWIVLHNLDTGDSKELLNLYDGSDSDVQISGLATEKPGWVLVSTHDCASQESWSCDRIMALNVDDGTIVNLAQTESCAEDSFTVPTGVVSRDFTKAWFNTDFGSCGQNGTIVELAIDQLDD